MKLCELWLPFFSFERFSPISLLEQPSTKGQTSIEKRKSRIVHMKAPRLADTPPWRVDGIRFHVTSSRSRLSRAVSSHLVTVKRFTLRNRDRTSSISCLRFVSFRMRLRALSESRLHKIRKTLRAMLCKGGKITFRRCWSWKWNFLLNISIIFFIRDWTLWLHPFSSISATQTSVLYYPKLKQRISK